MQKSFILNIEQGLKYVCLLNQRIWNPWKKRSETDLMYCKYSNLAPTQVEIISDPNYLVRILFER